MSVLRTCVRCVIITSDHLGNVGAVIEFIRHHGLEIQELIFKTKMENPKFIK